MRFTSPFVAIAIPLLACSSLFGQLPAPELLALGRIGGQIGQPIAPLENASGQNLAGGQFLLSGKDGATTIDATMQPGLYAVRSKNEYGLSNARHFLVTREPWTVAVNNESWDRAIELAPNQFIQDECPDRGFNYYRIRVEHDQWVQINSLARCLDSRARLNLVLRAGLQPESTNTKTIESSTASIDRDARLIAPLKANTDYLLTVSDHLYRGGPEYRYALQLETLNGPTEVDPDRGLTAWKRTLDRLRNLASKVSEKGHVFLHQRSSILRPPTASDSIQHVEQGPNETATSIKWPGLVDGTFDQNADVDRFDIECEKDANIVLEVVSQRIGELTDPMITVDRVENIGQPNEKKVRVGENDDMPSVGNGEMRFLIKDAIFSFRAPDKGTYRVSIRNLQRLESPHSKPRYVLEVRAPNPGFVLATHWAHPIRDLDQSKPTSNTISTGGALLLTVHLFRFDAFAGAVDVTVEGLPPDILGGRGVIASDQIATTMTLWHDPTKSSAQKPEEGSMKIDKLRIVGVHRATETSPEMQADAIPVEVVFAQLDTFRAPLSRGSDGIFLARPEKRTSPLSVQLGKPSESANPAVLEAVRGQPLKIPLAVSRRAGGESSVITVRLRQIPTKVTAGEVRIEAKSNEGTLELQVPKDAPVGEYVLNALCEAAISIPNPDPAAKEKTINSTIQLPSSSVRIKIGDAP